MAELMFPMHYVPRPYQQELHHMWRTKRIGVAVLPRQSGKDMGGAMELCDARLKRPKTTGVYVGTTNGDIRDILWDKTYQDPITGEHLQLLQDNVPASLVKWTDTFMTGRFTNKSLLKFQGFFQSGQEKSGVGTSYDDYLITELALFGREDPVPRIQPIIEQDSGNKRLMAVSTPRGRGRNPLWMLMQSIEGRKDAQVIIRTIDDLNEMMRREGLPPVMTEQRLEEIEGTYLQRFGNTRMFNQEYHVDFAEADAAAVYGEALVKLKADGRDIDFNLDTGYPVYVQFDIGSAGKASDATAWMAFQWIYGRLFIYDCGEGHGKPLPEYVDELRTKHWFPQLRTIILPWDAEHHEVSIRETPADMVRKKFPNVAVLAKSSKVYKTDLPYDEITDIQATRMALYNTIIHKSNCSWVLECMEKFRYKYDKNKQEWSNVPFHDQYSHMMDAMRYVVQATKEVEFFGGAFFGQGANEKAVNYEEDWSEVWHAR